MIFNYKGESFSEEEINQRIDTSISIESDINIRTLLINLSNTRLLVLKPLLPDIQEICDCLFLRKYMAAITLTNLLFETMVKLTLVYYDANGRTIDDGYDFENIHATELKRYNKRNLGENIEELLAKKIITAEVKNRLIDLKNLFRNPYSHGSNNEYVKTASTIIYKGELGSGQIQECKVEVTGNPYLLLDARRHFVKRYGIGYFAELVSYTEKLDKKLHKLYETRKHVNKKQHE